MKLRAYTDQIESNTIGGVRYDITPPNALVTEDNNAQNLAHLGKIMTGYAKMREQRFDEENNLALMNAKTEYLSRINTLLHDTENGLMNTKLGGASGVTATFQAEEKKIRGEITQNLPQYEHVLGLFNQEADMSTIKNAETLYKHEGKEYQAYKEVSLKNNLETAKEWGIANTNNPQVVVDGFLTGMQSIKMMYAPQGSEVVMAKQKEFTNDYMTGVLDKCLMDEDHDKAYEYLEVAKKRGMLDAETTLKYEQKVSKASEDTALYLGAMEVVAQFPHDEQKQKTAMLEKFTDYRPIGANELSNAINKSKGKGYELGGDGTRTSDCGLFTLNTFAELGIDLGTRTADGQYMKLEKEGKLIDIKDARDGDLVFWNVPENDAIWTPTDNIDEVDENHAYKGVNHVGIIKDGKVYQMGRNGLQAIDIDTYNVVGVGRVTSANLSELSRGKVVDLDKKIDKALDKERTKLKRQRTEYIDNNYRELNGAFQDYKINGGDYADLVGKAKVVANDEQLKGTKAHVLAESIINGDGVRGSRGGGNGGGSGYGQGRRNIMNHVKLKLQQGFTEEEIIDILKANNIELNPTEMEQFATELHKRDNGEGIYSPKFSDAKVIAKNRYGGVFGSGAEFEERWHGAMLMAQDEVMKYKREHNHVDPSPYDLSEIMYNLMKNQEFLTTAEPLGKLDFIFNPDKILLTNDAELRNHGISLQPLEGDDGQPYVRIRLNSGDFTDKAPEDVKDYLRSQGVRVK